MAVITTSNGYCPGRVRFGVDVVDPRRLRYSVAQFGSGRPAWARGIEERRAAAVQLALGEAATKARGRRHSPWRLDRTSLSAILPLDWACDLGWTLLTHIDALDVGCVQVAPDNGGRRSHGNEVGVWAASDDRALAVCGLWLDDSTEHMGLEDVP